VQDTSCAIVAHTCRLLTGMEVVPGSLDDGGGSGQPGPWV